jgi:hypothetical protein
VFARITTAYTADPSRSWEPELWHRILVRVEDVLGQMNGYEGGYFFMDRQRGKAIAIILWESEEAMQRSEEALRPLRKEIAEALRQQSRCGALRGRGKSRAGDTRARAGRAGA